jgi:hypothetical protein
MVPTAASRCKHCFHDFDAEEIAKKGLSGPVLLLMSAAAMAVLAATVLGVVVSWPIEERILVDQDTQSVVWTKKFRTRVETDRLAWNQITKLEYVISQNGSFSIDAIDMNGERHTIQSGKSPLSSEADKYSQIMEKPLEEVDNTRGFHKM